MSEIQMMWAYVRAFAHHHGTRGRSDRGVTTTEYVLIAAGVAAIAIAVVAIVKSKLLDKAHDIPTD